MESYYTALYSAFFHLLYQPPSIKCPLFALRLHPLLLEESSRYPKKMMGMTQ